MSNQTTIIIAILGLTISVISGIVSFNAFQLRKSTLELVLYKNISDAIKNFLEFSSKESSFKTDEEKKDFLKIKKLFKLEVLNNLEYACKKYLDNKVDQASFEEYYKDIISQWVAQIAILKTSSSDEVFQSIKRVNFILGGKSAKPNKKFFWLFIIGFTSYLTLLCNFKY